MDAHFTSADMMYPVAVAYALAKRAPAGACPPVPYEDMVVWHCHYLNTTARVDTPAPVALDIIRSLLH
jgi:hypothetical protein